MSVLSRWDRFRGETKPGSETIRSKVFEDICRQMQSRRQLRVMDFGSQTGNFKFFTGLGTAQYILADLPAQWLARDAISGDGADFNHAWFSEQGKLDVLLIWDLLNYFDLHDANRWFEQLVSYCRPGTFAYLILIHKPMMPAKPGAFHIIDAGQVNYRFEGGQRECPRYSQYQLCKIMPGFVVYRSYLLQNGMQEYVLEFKG